MTVNTIQHGTRNGYRKGCKDDNTCPKGSNGLTCHEASNKYQRDLKQLRNLSRQRTPVRTVIKPGAQGIRVGLGMPRTEPRDTATGPGPGESWPSQDMPTFDPPDSLVNAQVSDDPEPQESGQDVYNQPEFIITPGMRNDIAGKLGLFAAIIGMPFEAIDPYCGGIFAANVDKMIDAYLPLILRSPGAVKFFISKTGGWLDWIKALEATWPVVVAVYSHHLARTVQRDTRPRPDATMPPGGDDFNYTAA